jgi:hypothetical protein
MTFLGVSFIVFNIVTLLYYDPLYLTEKDGAMPDLLCGSTSSCAHDVLCINFVMCLPSKIR